MFQFQQPFSLSKPCASEDLDDKLLINFAVQIFSYLQSFLFVNSDVINLKMMRK